MSTKQTATQHILSHPDKDEIISKLLLGISPQEIHDNLAIRYSNPAEKRFVLSVKALQTFKNNSLDLYKLIKEDLSKTQAMVQDPSKELELSVQGNSAYKETMLKLAGQELDIKGIIINMITALNTRLEQIFNEHQIDPSNINTRTERLFNEMIAQWKGVIELYHKYVLQAPDQIIQHNMTITHIDQHIALVNECIRATLAEMDYEASLRFMEIYTEKLAQLDLPTEAHINQENKLNEVKLLNEQINKKMNSND